MIILFALWQNLTDFVVHHFKTKQELQNPKKPLKWSTIYIALNAIASFPGALGNKGT